MANLANDRNVVRAAFFPQHGLAPVARNISREYVRDIFYTCVCLGALSEDPQLSRSHSRHMLSQARNMHFLIDVQPTCFDSPQWKVRMFFNISVIWQPSIDASVSFFCLFVAAITKARTFTSLLDNVDLDLCGRGSVVSDLEWKLFARGDCAVSLWRHVAPCVYCGTSWNMEEHLAS